VCDELDGHPSNLAPAAAHIERCGFVLSPGKEDQDVCEDRNPGGMEGGQVEADLGAQQMSVGVEEVTTILESTNAPTGATVDQEEAKHVNDNGRNPDNGKHEKLDLSGLPLHLP
jgi:hypothetical protein